MSDQEFDYQKLAYDLKSQLDELRDLSKAALLAHERETKAWISLENATNNFSNNKKEKNDYMDALLDASEAEQKLKDALKKLI